MSVGSISIDQGDIGQVSGITKPLFTWNMLSCSQNMAYRPKIAPSPKWKPRAGRDRGRLDTLAPILEGKTSLVQGGARWWCKVHYLAQRMSIRRKGLRQRRVKALDTIREGRASGSL